MRVHRAKQPGLCPACSGPIAVGMMIALNRARRPNQGWVHVTCLRKTRDGETQDGTN